MNLAHLFERERPDLIVKAFDSRCLTRHHEDAAPYFGQCPGKWWRNGLGRG
jgi:hypothetical protein